MTIMKRSLACIDESLSKSQLQSVSIDFHELMRRKKTKTKTLCG